MQLRSIPAQLDELDLAIAKLTGRGHGTGLSKVGQLAFDPVASDAALAIRTSVHGWVRIWDEETPVRPQAAAARTEALRTVAGQAGLLAGARLASRPWVPDLAEDIRRVTEAGWRAVDTPPDVSFVGTCGGCGAGLYAAQGAALVTCRTCGLDWDAHASQTALLEAADHHWAPRVTIAKALGIPLVTIRDWCRVRPGKDGEPAKPARLAPVGVNPAGQPLYRVSDVQALKAQWLTQTRG